MKCITSKMNGGAQGTVIGKEYKQVIVKHGGQHIRVRPCWLQLRNKQQNIDNNKDDSKDNDLRAELKTPKSLNQLHQDVNKNQDLVIKNNIIENVSELNNNITNEDINQLTSSVSALSFKWR